MLDERAGGIGKENVAFAGLVSFARNTVDGAKAMVASLP
jgi:hypothetical protein